MCCSSTSAFKSVISLTVKMCNNLARSSCLGRIGGSGKEFAYFIRISFGVKEGFSSIVCAYASEAQCFCCLSSGDFGVESDFLFVQKGSSGVKALLLAGLLFVCQADSKLHVVLWRNNVVFFTLELFSLIGGWRRRNRW